MRVRQLDVLRGIAILLVLGFHSPVHPDAFGPLLEPLMTVWRRCGWVGVDLFFVLSGFLVSGLLFREHARHGRLRLGHFLIRRGLKIYPAFYVFMALTLGAWMALGHAVAWRPVLTTAAFLQNYFEPLPYWRHTWSLAIEEHFYLLVGLVLLLLSRARTQDPFRGLVPLYVGLVVVLQLFRFAALRFHPTFSEMVHMFPTHLRLDALLFGVVLSYAYHTHPERLHRIVTENRWLILAASLLCVAPCLVLEREHPAMFSAGVLGLTWGFGGIMLVSLYPRAPLDGRGLLARALNGVAAIGVYSYSIYLWHWILRAWSPRLAQAAFGSHVPALIDFGIYAATSIGVGVLMAKAVEVPVLRLRNRYFPSRSGALTSPAPEPAVSLAPPILEPVPEPVSPRD